MLEDTEQANQECLQLKHELRELWIKYKLQKK
jgi:hypothetical protein